MVHNSKKGPSSRSSRGNATDSKSPRKQQQPRPSVRLSASSGGVASSSTATNTSAEETPQAATAGRPSSSAISAKDQQRLLDIFASTFRAELESPGFEAAVQAVKGALFRRDFETAFGEGEKGGRRDDTMVGGSAAGGGDEVGGGAGADQLAIYAARWSPTRALCYASIFRGQVLKSALSEMLGSRRKRGVASHDGESSSSPAVTSSSEQRPSSAWQPQSLRMVAIGGGAAELVAFASLRSDPEFLQPLNDDDGDNVTFDACLVDSGPWNDTVRRLHASLTTPLPLSKYASAAARVANAPLVGPPAEPAGPARFLLDFRQDDVMNLSDDELSVRLGGGGGSGEAQNPVLVTILFTLNELYTAGGVPATTTFLRRLGALIVPGSLMLVVDSPGSYSEASVGREARRYPIRWLLDHTLLGEGDGGKYSPRWEKVEGQESVWFRLGDALSYPIQLENMRYQLHLYRAIR